MNKEEYATMNYYLTKLKYDMVKTMLDCTNEKFSKMYKKSIREIEDIQKFMIIEETKELEDIDNK